MTTLRLYNTLTKTKEDFVPLDANNVRMYVCGPTVYDYAHIGNARPVIVFDVLFRLLRHVYGDEHVTYVRNITDIDDKINARAASEGVPIREITEKTARQYNEDVAALGCLPPTIAPRATDNVEEMIAMIEALIAAGHAYPAEGHVLFDVSAKPDYGKLARRSLDEMIAGARVDVAPYKKSPMDFVLWKPSDDATPGWDSPWGRGRPGWHLECSAMIEGVFPGTDTIDIHGGGIDLVFPHHENEIAQSEGAHRNHPLAKVWMHNGFLQVEGEKMSKSLGNFVTINELLNENIFGERKWSGQILRSAMLMTHYRQPINFTWDKLKYAEIKLDSWYSSISEELAQSRHDLPTPSEETMSALCDDLNFHGVEVHLDRLESANTTDSKLQMLSDLRLVGIDLQRFWSDVRQSHGIIDQEYIDRTIAARLAARKAKDFKESDRIRDELLAQGIVLKDNADGTTTWDVKR